MSARYTKFSRLTALERDVRLDENLDKISGQRGAVWFRQMVIDSLEYATDHCDGMEDALVDLFQVAPSARYLSDLEDLQEELRQS